MGVRIGNWECAIDPLVAIIIASIVFGTIASIWGPR